MSTRIPTAASAGATRPAEVNETMADLVKTHANVEAQENKKTHKTANINRAVQSVGKAVSEAREIGHQAAGSKIKETSMGDKAEEVEQRL